MFLWVKLDHVCYGQAIAARMKALPENGTVLLETSLRGVKAVKVAWC